MKKEKIYELIENAYKDKNLFNKYLTSFISGLEDEGYLEMANVIKKIQESNTNPIMASNNSKSTIRTPRKNIFDNYSPEISKDAELIFYGYIKEVIKSVILYGSPGTGKTYFANQLATYMNIPIYKLSLSEIMDSKYGETIKRFEVFFRGHMNERCIIFIDEAESLFTKRGKQNDVFESDRLLTTALQLFDLNRDALLLISTNLINNIDSAIKRRFDFGINFDIGKINVRKLFERSVGKYPFEHDREEIKIIAQSIAQNLINPKFSDIEYLSKRYVIRKLVESKGEIETEIRNLVNELNKGRQNV